jgi:PE family
MSYAIATPETLAAATADLATIDSSLSAAHTAAATQTVALAPAAADEVSASIAHLFSQHATDGTEYQIRRDSLTISMPGKAPWSEPMLQYSSS